MIESKSEVKYLHSWLCRRVGANVEVEVEVEVLVMQIFFKVCGGPSLKQKAEGAALLHPTLRT